MCISYAKIAAILARTSFALLFLVSVPSRAQYTISTFAGGGPADGTPALQAALGFPSGVATDAGGNVYVSCDLNQVYRIDARGSLTIIAGDGSSGYFGDGGLAPHAGLSNPTGLALDTAGNLYIADAGNNRIRKVGNGVITTVAGNGSPGYSGDGSLATSASLNAPNAIALDNSGNLYIADTGNHRIRKVSGGVITTVAGTGTAGYSGDGGSATSATLNTPSGVAIDSAGNLFIADTTNNRIRKVAGGTITTVAGNGAAGFSQDGGAATSTALMGPLGVAIGPSGILYIVDSGSGRIRTVDSGIIHTVAGQGGGGSFPDGIPAVYATLRDPKAIAFDGTGSFYIVDTFNFCVRKVSASLITTIAGNGQYYYTGDGRPAASSVLGEISGVTEDSAGRVYFSELSTDHVRMVVNGVVSTVAGLAGADVNDGQLATKAGLAFPVGLASDSGGNLYIVDSGHNRIRKVTNGIIATVAGSGQQGFSGDGGPATSAALFMPSDLAVDNGVNLYIADVNNGRVRKVTNGTITTVAGGGTQAVAGGLSATSVNIAPRAIALDSAGNLYIAGDNRVLKITDGVVTIVAGDGVGGHSGDGGPAVNAELNGPSGVAVDSAGNIYIADTLNNVIRKVSNGIITTIAGGGHQGLRDGGDAKAASFSMPWAVFVDSRGNIYVADFENRRIRLLTPTTPTPALTTVTPNYSIAGGASFTLTVNGSGFTSGSVVQWNGTNLTTTYRSATQITASVPVNLITAAGSASLTVLNAGTPASNSLTFNIIAASESLGLSPNALQFGANSTHTTLTGPQTVVVQAPPGVSWFASAMGGFLSVSPSAGTGSGSFTVSLLASALLSSGSATGQIAVTATGLVNSPQTVNVTVKISTASQITGSFDTPLNNSAGLAGSIAVTGWALDTTEIEKVDIWREPVASEHTTGLVYIGDAVFVEGARPDVEGAYSSLPRNGRAGWGYLMLTNFLPNGNGSAGYGNGTYKIHAIAHAAAGKSLDLGTKTITVDNTDAVKPFGAIDTPGQGETVSGSTYVNYGWALTKQPNYVPTDGSTLEVYVDGQPMGRPVYNNYRSDIATLFPGYANSGGAVGYFALDTTALANGVHTISWSVTDSVGNADGIGSRYFNVLNTGGMASSAPMAPMAERPRRLAVRHPQNRRIDIEELGRIELPVEADAGYLVINGERRALPIGSSLKDGVFYWQLGPGFLGTYNLEFHRAGAPGRRVTIQVHPKN